MSDLVHNERAKLLANALDRASTAALAVGVLGPVVSATYGLGPTDRPVPLLLLFTGTILWVVIASAFHLMARPVLGRLR